MCKEVYYCDRECQVKDWKQHQKACKKPPEKLKIEDYELLDLIGEGNYTQIFKAIHKPSNVVYALKKAEKSKLMKQERHLELFVERHCLRKLQEVKGVVDFFDNFQDPFHLYIAMEFLQGEELWNLCNIWGIKCKQRAHFYFYQVASTLKEIHAHEIAHRDIKPENIMVVEGGKAVKFIDFGTAKDIKENIKSKGNGSTGRKFFEHFVGTPNYMPPECINNKFSNKKSDIYSLGGLLYNLISGFPPFMGGSEYLIFKDVMEKKAPKMYDFLFDKLEVGLISSMMSHDSEERPDIEEVLDKIEEWNIPFEEIKATKEEEFFEGIRSLFPPKDPKPERSEVRTKFEEVRLQFEEQFGGRDDYVSLKRHLKYCYQQVLHFYDLKKFEFPDIEIAQE